jgi:hypothetical protein
MFKFGPGTGEELLSEVWFESSIPGLIGRRCLHPCYSGMFPPSSRVGDSSKCYCRTFRFLGERGQVEETKYW